MKAKYKGLRFSNYIVIIVVFIVCILSFSACGSSGDETSNTNEEKTVIKWMVYGTKSMDSDWVFEAFNKELGRYLPDVEVEFEVINENDYRAEWEMKMATNTWVDIAWIGEDVFDFSDEVKDGNFMAIDYLLSTSGQEVLEAVPENLWEMEARGGNTFAIPVAGALYRMELGLVTNESYATGYDGLEGLTKIFTEDYTTNSDYMEIEKYLDYLFAGGMMDGGISYSTFTALADRGFEGIYGGDSPFVIKISDEVPKIYNKYELPEYREYFETMHRWYERGYIRQDINEVINPKADDGTLGGSVLFVHEIGEEGISPGSLATEYEALVIPLEDDRYIGYETVRNTLVIPKSSKNPTQAMEVINLLYSEEGKDLYRLIVNGIEGEHYISFDDGTYARMRDNDDQLLYGLPQYSIGSITSNYELMEGQFDRMKALNDGAVKSRLIRFDIDTRMVISGFTKVDIIVDEYLEALSSGSEEDWERTYGEFISSMKKAGSDEVIEELQWQLEEFLSNE